MRKSMIALAVLAVSLSVSAQVYETRTWQQVYPKVMPLRVCPYRFDIKNGTVTVDKTQTYTIEKTQQSSKTTIYTCSDGNVFTIYRDDYEALIKIEWTHRDVITWVFRRYEPGDLYEIKE